MGFVLVNLTFQSYIFVQLVLAASGLNISLCLKSLKLVNFLLEVIFLLNHN